MGRGSSVPIAALHGQLVYVGVDILLLLLTAGRSRTLAEASLTVEQFDANQRNVQGQTRS